MSDLLSSIDYGRIPPRTLNYLIWQVAAKSYFTFETRSPSNSGRIIDFFDHPDPSIKVGDDLQIINEMIYFAKANPRSHIAIDLGFQNGMFVNIQPWILDKLRKYYLYIYPLGYPDVYGPNSVGMDARKFWTELNFCGEDTFIYNQITTFYGT